MAKNRLDRRLHNQAVSVSTLNKVKSTGQGRVSLFRCRIGFTQFVCKFFPSLIASVLTNDCNFIWLPEVTLTSCESSLHVL
jgi:hypothetical protein